MIVYRDHEEDAATRELVDACRARTRALAGGGGDHDEVTGLLIEVGLLEAGVADALQPERDGRDIAVERLRAASLAAGRLFHRSATGAAAVDRAAVARALAEALDSVAALPLPASVRLRTPEGYAYYALYPETYLEAARRFRRALLPRRAVCVGLRSIGTSLSAVVAATLEAEGCAVESLTLRPRGHPFDRAPVTTGELRAWLGARAGSFFTIVDEGPGLSGSSFCGTAALLGGLGVPDKRIVLFPSHVPDPTAFRSQEARERWPWYPMFHVAFEELVQGVAAWPPGSPELSAGAWRSLFYRDGVVQPAVLGAQERRKYLSPGPILHKFAGLGRYGAQARERANRLAAVGFVPAVQGLQHGFTQQSFVAGRPLGRGDGEGRFLRFAARYLGHLGRTFATGEPARPESLLPMLVANATEALGEGAVPPGFERHAGSLPPAPAVALDGRVLPHEWLRTGHGYLKTDATDHHRDHGYPGSADIAWDVAGVIAEFDLTEAAAGEFVAAASEALGDPWLPRRLLFHAAAYLAYRTGHAAFAAAALGAAPDGLRMRRARDRYRTLLASSLARL